jgi:uncharacterized protein with PIN domain
VTILDAYALVAFLADEPAAQQVEDLLRDRVRHPAVQAVNLAEAFDVLVRRYGHPANVVASKLDWLLAAPLQVIEADEVVAREAGRIRAERYHRTQAPISLGDAFALATASLHDARLATADPALAAVATREGVEVLGLPDTEGRLPV